MKNTVPTTAQTAAVAGGVWGKPKKIGMALFKENPMVCRLESHPNDKGTTEIKKKGRKELPLLQRPEKVPTTPFPTAACEEP